MWSITASTTKKLALWVGIVKNAGLLPCLTEMLDAIDSNLQDL
jgi:hypothetical protein